MKSAWWNPHPSMLLQSPSGEGMSKQRCHCKCYLLHSRTHPLENDALVKFKSYKREHLKSKAEHSIL